MTTIDEYVRAVGTSENERARGKQFTGEEPLVQRLLYSIQYNIRTGCWLWIGNLRPNGYGRMWYRGKSLSAHRTSRATTLSCESETGRVSADGAGMTERSHTHGVAVYGRSRMDDSIVEYGRRVAEAVQDACVKAASHRRYGTDAALAACEIDLPAIIASVPKPEAQHHDAPTCAGAWYVRNGDGQPWRLIEISQEHWRKQISTRAYAQYYGPLQPPDGGES